MGDQEQDVFGSESGGDGADAAEKPSSLLEMTEEANADKEDHEEKEDKEEVHQVMKRPSSKVMKRPSSAPVTKSANNSDKEEKSVKKDKSEKKGKEDKSEKKDKKDKSEKKDKETKPPMKRPATTRLEKMAELFEFQEDEAADDDGEKEDDAMEGGGEGEEIDGRDRSKSRRFHQMLKAGSLPAAALEAWQKASTRAEQTTLINTCLKKDGKKYIIKPEFSTPSSYQMDKNMSKQERAQDIQEGFGKLIFQKKYGLSDDELDSCLSSGEVISWKHGGLQLFAATNIMFSSSATKTVEEKLEGQRIELDEEGGAAFGAIFGSMLPEVSLTGTNAPLQAVDSSSATQPCPALALCFGACASLFTVLVHIVRCFLILEYSCLQL